MSSQVTEDGRSRGGGPSPSRPPTPTEDDGATTATLSKWNFMVESRLTLIASTLTQISAIEEKYKGEMAKHVRLKEVHGMDTLKQTLSRMKRMLEKKEAALQKLVTAAEQAIANHVEEPQLSLNQVPFFNMKEVKKNDERLQFSTHFLQNVTFNESGVHIPLEIYEGWMGHRYKVVWWHASKHIWHLCWLQADELRWCYAVAAVLLLLLLIPLFQHMRNLLDYTIDPQILNGLKWSAALEEVFKENLRLDPTLKWQYFGSQRGFMRVYPAFRWPEIPNLPDLFDFNNEVGWVIPCLNTLLQATSHHKRMLFDAVDQLQEGNLTSYANALEFAFEAFKKVCFK
ncbi:hypothetical protein B566_EDAN007835 [Ephemera danica]|nr:hypothetical protein B566_EDAN007835 [Ephemera danica]